MFTLICTPNKQLSKQLWGWWFETPSHPLWRHCNAYRYFHSPPPPPRQNHMNRPVVMFDTSMQVMIVNWSCFNDHRMSVCVILLWTGDVMWWHRSGSTLVQVMACCQMPPSHYLNQCRPITSEVWWRSSEDNLTEHAQETYPHISLNIKYILVHMPLSLSAKELKPIYATCSIRFAI